MIAQGKRDRTMQKQEEGVNEHINTKQTWESGNNDYCGMVIGGKFPDPVLTFIESSLK